MCLRELTSSRWSCIDQFNLTQTQRLVLDIKIVPVTSLRNVRIDLNFVLSDLTVFYKLIQHTVSSGIMHLHEFSREIKTRCDFVPENASPPQYDMTIFNISLDSAIWVVTITLGREPICLA